ncbi:MAG: 4-hydroxy-tetrahydrodipicolinate synthase [bacterium]
MMFQGAFTAIVTPFRDGAFDEAAYRELIDFQIEGGIHGIVSCGTTGESATLSHEEHHRVVETAIEQVAGRVPVIAGTGSNSTRESISLTQHAEKAGANGCLVVTPYYNKPNPQGLYEHHKAISEASSLPIIMYNVPGRTGRNMLPDEVARSAELPTVVGIKEATGDLTQVSDVIALCPDDFVVLSGDDFTVLPLISVGGRGVIGVVSNIVPGKMAELCDAALAGDWAGAREFHYELRPLNKAMFMETNPIPVKTALKLMGRITGELRLPLVPMSEANEERLASVLKEAGVI